MNLQDRSFLVAKTHLAKKEKLVQKAQNKLEKLQKKVVEAAIELKAAESECEIARFQVEVFKRKRNIEELFWRFPHIGEQILEKIDNPSVANCRQVNKWWCNFVDTGKALLIRKIQRHICIKSEKLTQSLNNLSMEVLKSFENHARMKRFFADSQGRHQRETYTVEDCRKNVFMRLISESNPEPCIHLVCDLMLDNMEVKNPTCKNYGTALHMIASYDNLAMFKLIFERTENKNPKDEIHENTPLHIAAQNGCLTIAKFILENSNTDNINIPNRWGKTPLNLAEEKNHKDMSKLLMSAISEQNNIQLRNPRKKRKLT